MSSQAGSQSHGPSRRGFSKGVVTVTLIVGLLIGAGATYVIAGAGRTTTSTIALPPITSTTTLTTASTTISTLVSTSTSTTTVTTTSGTICLESGSNATNAFTTDCQLGVTLGLQISTNASGGLSISTHETNLLNRVNNVTTAGNWSYPNVNSEPCGNSDQFPIEYAVLQGNYDTSNYTSASALTLYDPGDVYLCPTEIFPGTYLFFAPLSDNVSHFSAGQEASFLASASYSTTGYWTRSGSTASFHKFPPGPAPSSQRTNGETSSFSPLRWATPPPSAGFLLP